MSESPLWVQLLAILWFSSVTREPVPIIPSDCRYGATVVSRRAMPESSGSQASAPVISEREKNSVAYRLPAAAVALVPWSAARAWAAPVTAAAPEPAVAGRTAAPAPSAPIVLTATQVAAASTNNGRRPCRNKDVIVSPLSIRKQAEAEQSFSVYLTAEPSMITHDLLGSLLLIHCVTLPGANFESQADHRAPPPAPGRRHATAGREGISPPGKIDAPGMSRPARQLRPRRRQRHKGAATEGNQPWTGSWKSS